MRSGVSRLLCGIAVVVASLFVLPGTRGQLAAGRLDVAGAVTVTAALMVAVYAIVNGNEVGWTTARTDGLLMLAVALLGVFFLGILNNGMNILNVPIDIQLIAKGAIIVAALAIAARRG